MTLEGAVSYDSLRSMPIPEFLCIAKMAEEIAMERKRKVDAAT